MPLIQASSLTLFKGIMTKEQLKQAIDEQRIQCEQLILDLAEDDELSATVMIKLDRLHMMEVEYARIVTEETLAEPITED